MYRILLSVIIVTFLVPNIIVAEGYSNVKAAFIRDGNLWTFINGEEKQITTSGKVYNQQWSQDGYLLLYQMEVPSKNLESEVQNEIWVYHIKTGKKMKVFYNGHSPKWAPKTNIVTFLAHEVLNISDLKRFYNVSMGVNSYTWIPDGSGFLLASQADSLPSGWTSPILYKKLLNEQYNDINIFEDVEELFTVPKEIGIGEKQIPSINASDFMFSPSTKWISFIVSPTASWSMDSNMLCVLSRDGKSFEVLDEVIFGVGKPKWAPNKDILAYIAGGGRIVFGFKGKKLNVKEMPVSGSLTPKDYTELDFTWINDQSIVTSRVKEAEWSNDFKEHPLPSLYTVDINDTKQEQITKPPKGYGDYNPTFIQTDQKLIWYRGKSITDEDRNIWRSNADGTNAELWLENVDVIEIYEKFGGQSPRKSQRQSQMKSQIK